MIIAIDGPAASGKSTVAKLLAERLNFTHFDTGAMYRAVTWFALRQKVNISDEKALVALCRKLKMTFAPEGTAKKVFLNGQEITDEIRSPEVDAGVSMVAQIPKLRELLVKEQRQIGEKGNFVVDGRDIGTAVFPKAPLKIFLTASVNERAKRRQADFLNKGEEVGQVWLEKRIISRDKIDSTRKSNPLSKAEDAHVIDTTEKPVEQVVDEILALYLKLESDQEQKIYKR